MKLVVAARTCHADRMVLSLPLRTRVFELIMRPLDKLRPKTVGRAHGRVLEVGVATGLNLAHYPPVERLVGIDPDDDKLTIARQRAAALGLTVELVCAGAETLPFPDASFDVVIVTWVLCSIPELAPSLREINRVLVPGGELAWVEHGRSPHRLTHLGQRLAGPVWTGLTGCHLTREPRRLVAEAGFEEVQYVVIGAGPLNPFPMYAGLARRAEAEPIATSIGDGAGESEATIPTR